LIDSVKCLHGECGRIKLIVTTNVHKSETNLIKTKIWVKKKEENKLPTKDDLETYSQLLHLFCTTPKNKNKSFS